VKLSFQIEKHVLSLSRSASIWLTRDRSFGQITTNSVERLAGKGSVNSKP